MDLVERAKNIGSRSGFFRRCRIVSLVISGISLSLGEILALASLAFPRNIAIMMTTISQTVATVGVVVPVIIAIITLAKARSFLREQKKNTASTAMAILITKTKALIAVLVLILIVFAFTFLMFAFDAELPVIIFFKYYGVVLADMTIFPAFWYFTQGHAHRRGERLFQSFFSCGSITSNTNETSETGTSPASGKKRSSSSSSNNDEKLHVVVSISEPGPGSPSSYRGNPAVASSVAAVVQTTSSATTISKSTVSMPLSSVDTFSSDSTSSTESRNKYDDDDDDDSDSDKNITSNSSSTEIDVESGLDTERE
jgi:hypothetical protein